MGSRGYPGLQSKALSSGRQRAVISRWLGHVMAMLAVMLPGLVVALDHHGAERIPTHMHLSADGAPVSTHSHEFEVSHRHGAMVESPVSQIATFVSLDGAPALGESSPALEALISFIALAVVTASVSSAQDARGWIARQSRRPAEFVFPPPAAPPRLPLLST